MFGGYTVLVAGHANADHSVKKIGKPDFGIANWRAEKKMLGTIVAVQIIIVVFQMDILTLGKERKILIHFFLSSKPFLGVTLVLPELNGANATTNTILTSITCWSDLTVARDLGIHLDTSLQHRKTVVTGLIDQTPLQDRILPNLA